GRDRAIMRWLAHRGGAAHHRLWRDRGLDMPVAVAIGANPATMLAAAMPLPEAVPELQFAGLLGARRARLARAASVPLMVPAEAEIVIEGLVSATETAPEGPYGDHTGYYHAVEDFPGLRVTAMTRRHAVARGRARAPVRGPPWRPARPPGARRERAVDGASGGRDRDRGTGLGDRDRARRPLRRPHRLLQRGGGLSGHARHGHDASPCRCPRPCPSSSSRASLAPGAPAWRAPRACR